MTTSEPHARLLRARGDVPWSRLVAISALAALVPLAVVSSALVLSVAATLVVLALALWDVRAERVKASAA